jgi:hypothetical protein
MEAAMSGPLKLIVCVLAFSAGLYMAKHRHPPTPGSVRESAAAAADDRSAHMSAQYWPSSFASQ